MPMTPMMKDLSRYNLFMILVIFCVFITFIYMTKMQTFHTQAVNVWKVINPKMENTTWLTFQTSRQEQQTITGDNSYRVVIENVKRPKSGLNGSVMASVKQVNKGNSELLLTVQLVSKGRLGNQMFKYASLLGIARAVGRQPFIPPGLSLEAAFRLTHIAEHTDEEIKSWPLLSEENFGKFDSKMLQNLTNNADILAQNASVGIYLQSWKYFENISDEIRREFTFRESALKPFKKLMSKWRQKVGENGVLVGVHVRRGDMVGTRGIRQGYSVAPISYYEQAFARMKKTLSPSDVLFIVVSDDLPWCRKHLMTISGSDVIVAPKGSLHAHLALLARCDHVIISSGTFGWWGAWLAGGLVIYYNGYPAKGSHLSQHFAREDFYPPHWVGLGE